MANEDNRNRSITLAPISEDAKATLVRLRSVEAQTKANIDAILSKGGDPKRSAFEERLEELIDRTALEDWSRDCEEIVDLFDAILEALS